MDKDQDIELRYATVMQRHYLGEESFIFSPSHIVIGYVDEETGVFYDTMGKEYESMLNPNMLYTECPIAYHNALTEEELDSIVEDPEADIEDKLGEYEYLTGAICYIVSFLDNGNVFSFPLDLENLRESIQSSLEGSNIGELPEGAKVSYGNAAFDDYYQMDCMNPEFSDIIMDIIDGKYTVEQLQTMAKRYERDREDLLSTLETIYLQIEGIKNHTATNIHEEDQGKDFTKEDLVSEAGLQKLQEILEEETEEEAEEVVEEEKEESKRLDINDLFNKITKTLIAQDEPLRRVLVELARKEMNTRKKRDAILLTGSTGVGKSELMRLLAEYLDRPFFKVNATTLTAPGYTGQDIEEVLWDLYLECGKDKKKAEKAIIFFDEIDKKGSRKNGDVSGRGVLNLLLPFIEGAKYDAVSDMKSSTKSVEIDTSDMIVFFGGAFTEVYKDLYDAPGIGFGKELERKARPATTQDFIDKGMMTDEFMGRVSVVKLNDLSKDDLIRLMRESDQSAIKIQEKLFDELGVKITFTEGCLDTIATRALEKKTGARGLNSIIDESTWEAFERVYSESENSEIEGVIITEQTLKNPSNYELVKKQKTKRKVKTKTKGTN